MDNIRKKISKKDLIIYILMGITGVMITVTAIVNRQEFFQIMPLYVSLVIASLQSKVNRFASLLGSFNSIVYGIVYYHFNIYGAALSAVLFSFPIQLITFIRWNKNKIGNSTKLRRMSVKQRIIVAVGFLASLAVLWIVLPMLGSDYVFLDSVSTLLGILIYFLTMFAFIEYPFFMIINGILTIVLYITMLKDSPETMTHLIFSVYSFVCICFAFFEARKLYRIQQKETATESENRS